MQEQGFHCCCTASEVGYFSGRETIEDLRNVRRNEGIVIATQGNWQPKAHAEKLLKAGFKDVGHYKGHGGMVHLFVKGLIAKPKGLTKPRARSKAGRQ